MSESKNKTFKVVTLGCRTNQYESQAYQDQLMAMGYHAAQETEKADICIVNTCTVTESADSSSRHAIRQLVKENEGAQVLVTGCSADRQPDVIKQLEGVSHVVPNREKEALLARLFPEEELPEFSIKSFDSHTRAFLKVQDGCNSYCTYCIIPYVRGRSRSRTMDEILDEAKQLISNGFKEIVLTGINIGDFDGGVNANANANPNVNNESPSPTRLSDLVRAVDALPGLERLRLSSIDPDEVDDDLASAILNGKKTCPSMHIVLQSGSNVILKKMNRKYTRQVFLKTIDRLKEASSDFTFTTDVIVGFPGETEEDFMETLEVMRYVKFTKVHMFPYSDRPRTRSALMPNKVPVEVMKERKQKVLALAEQLAFELRELYIKRRMRVLTESLDSSKPGEIPGHTDNFLNVWIQHNELQPNQLVEVELISNSPQGLIGRLVNPLESSHK